MAKTLNSSDALAPALTHLFLVDDDNTIKEIKAGLACTPHTNVLLPGTGATSAPVGRSFRTGGVAGVAPAVYGVDFPNYVVNNAAAFSVFCAVNQFNSSNAANAGTACIFGSDSSGIKIGPGMQMDPATGKFFKHNNNGAVVASGTLNTAGTINGAGIKSFGMTVTAGGVVKMFINGVVDSNFTGGIANTGSQFGAAWTNADFSLIGGQPANSWVSFDYAYVADFIGTVVSDAEMLRLHDSLTGGDAFALVSVPAGPVGPTLTGAISIAPETVNSTGGQANWTAATGGVTPYTYEISTDNGVTYPTSWSVNNFTFTGLTPATTYPLKVRVRGADNALGGTIISGSLTTAAAAQPLLTGNPLKNNMGIPWATQACEAFVHHQTTGALVVKKTGITTDASGVPSFRDAALTLGSTYSVRWRLTANGAQGLDDLTATA